MRSHPRQVLGKPTLVAVAGLGLKTVDGVDDVIEPTTGTGSNATAGNGDGKVGFAGAGAADEHGIALLGDEATAGEVDDEGLVDRRTIKVEVIEVLGKRQLGDGELVFVRAGLLLVDFGVEQITAGGLRPRLGGASKASNSMHMLIGDPGWPRDRRPFSNGAGSLPGFGTAEPPS